MQETQKEQLNLRRLEIIEKCELEKIVLPTVDDPMDVDFNSSSHIQVFDYSTLNRSHLKDRRPSDKEKQEGEFKRKIEALVAEIESTAPNLKALDQYEQLQEKEKDVIEEYEAVRKVEKEISDKFSKIRERR